jgi:hypothetical protein
MTCSTPRKSLLTSLFQREAFPLFGKEGPGEIYNNLRWLLIIFSK